MKTIFCCGCWFYFGFWVGIFGWVVVTAEEAEVDPVFGRTVGLFLFLFLFCGGDVVGLLVCRFVFGPCASCPFGGWAEGGRGRDSDSCFGRFGGVRGVGGSGGLLEGFSG